MNNRMIAGLNILFAHQDTISLEKYGHDYIVTNVLGDAISRKDEARLIALGWTVIDEWWGVQL